MNQQPKKALSMKDVQEMLGIGRKLAWRLPRMGLKTIKLGRRRLVRPEDLDAFLAEQAAAQNGEAPTTLGVDLSALLGKKVQRG